MVQEIHREASGLAVPVAAPVLAMKTWPGSAVAGVPTVESGHV